MSEIFKTLYEIDVNRVKKDKEIQGKRFSYLSWAWAISEVKKRYEDFSYEIEMFDGKPYLETNLGYMVFTKVKINGKEDRMWLTVMDGANRVLKKDAYVYEVAEYSQGRKTGKMIEKKVEAVTMADINKAIMRCLVKNIAVKGLGLYIFQGEDMPDDEYSDEIGILKTTLKSMNYNEIIIDDFISSQIPTDEIAEYFNKNIDILKSEILIFIEKRVNVYSIKKENFEEKLKEKLKTKGFSDFVINAYIEQEAPDEPLQKSLLSNEKDFTDSLKAFANAMITSIKMSIIASERADLIEEMNNCKKLNDFERIYNLL
jgi:hypothetical protein